MKSSELLGKTFGKITVLEKVKATNRRKAWKCKCECGNIVEITEYRLLGGGVASCGCNDPIKNDLTGKVFGRLKVLEATKERKCGCIVYKCLCECGNIVLVRSDNLRSGETKSCGCLQKEKVKQLGESQKYDLTGKRFTKLVALNSLRKNNIIYWKCRCDCGNYTEVKVSHLLGGNIKSCGCLVHDTCFKDLKNKRFGKLLVLEETTKRDEKRSIIWKCKCDCGNIVEVPSTSLLELSKQSCGCLTSRGEQKITEILQEGNFLFETQKNFSDLISLKGCKLRFDFYLPEFNTCIEFQGIQHYDKNNFYYSEDGHLHDEQKRAYCKNKGIHLIEIPYTDIDLLSLEYLIKLLNRVSNI